jgi:hypothetical protein
VSKLTLHLIHKLNPCHTFPIHRVKHVKKPRWKQRVLESERYMKCRCPMSFSSWIGFSGIYNSIQSETNNHLLLFSTYTQLTTRLSFPFPCHSFELALSSVQSSHDINILRVQRFLYFRFTRSSFLIHITHFLFIL